MNTEQVLDEFRASGALREGHFILSSGLHSGVFLQKNLVFQYPDRTERLCKALAELVLKTVGEVDLCVSPAVGGIILRAGVRLRVEVGRAIFRPASGGRCGSGANGT